MHSATPVVSIVIPSYNSRRTIRACLDSLKSQHTIHPYEVIIADSSDDGTDHLVQKEYHWVHLITLQERTFPGPARNAAVSHSQGKILAFLDADCTATPEWIDCIITAHQKGWMVVGGAVLNGTPNSYVGTAEHITEFSEYSPHQRPRTCRMIPTCNLSLNRKVFDAAGGFQHVDTGENLFKSEDLLLCHRIQELDYIIQFDPDIKIYHHNRVSLWYFLRNQFSLGFSSAVARRLVRTKGNIFLKYLPLSILIPVVKAGILIRRTALYSISDFLSLLYHLPLIFIGSCFYTIGFFRGVKVPLKVPLHDCK